MKKIFLFVLALLLWGCFFDSGSDRIIGKYEVLWIDLLENQTISEEYEKYSSSSAEIVPAYVFAVGHNDDFIIAKQHPTGGFQNNFKVNTLITRYYIIDMNRKVLKEGRQFFGPLTKTEFNGLRKKLGIEAIGFNMEYPEEP